jgi:hypothetical protein
VPHVHFICLKLACTYMVMVAALELVMGLGWQLVKEREV